MGRATHETAHAKRDAFLAAYAQLGTITHACEAAGIGRTQHYDWMREDPEYPHLFSEAGKRAKDALVREATRRAIEGTDKPVYQGGKLVGIVTDRDLRMAVVETVSGQGLTVRSVMTPKPVTVAEDAPLREAAGLLSKNKFNALPVLSAAGELAGVLTTTDVLNGLVRALDAEKK